MTTYFMATEMAGFNPSDGSSYEETSSGYYTSSFCRAGTEAGQGSASQYIFTTDVGSLPDDCWYHFAFRRRSTGPDVHTLISLVDGSTEVFRIRATGDSPDDSSASLQMQALISAVWTNVGSAVSVSNNSLQYIDLHIVGNSGTGTATLYVGSTERATATANLTVVTSINTARFYGINSVNGCVISECVISDAPTVGGRLFTVPVSGAGSTSSWTGDYTNIDEIVYADGDFIYSASANQVSTFTLSNPTLTGYVVQAVAVYARSKRGASGPQNLQLALRVSGTDYYSSSKALTLAYASYGNIWETNPATSLAWTNTPIATIQAGVKSIA